ncbi:NPCBM/NEW2 domain-containing protein [Lentzea sp. NPDC051838]|uniref:NPCBM/NEW2 domain-containing protein n=1 Tax=Lentzea sp. NPDC051838 TaxID=3154849 RepID=UPI00343C2E46
MAVVANQQGGAAALNGSPDEELPAEGNSHARRLGVAADGLGFVLVIVSAFSLEGVQGAVVTFGSLTVVLSAGFLLLARVRSRSQKRAAWVAILVGLVVAGLALIVPDGKGEQKRTPAAPTTGLPSHTSPPSATSTTPVTAMTTSSTRTSSSNPPPSGIDLGDLAPVAADFGYDKESVSLNGSSYVRAIQFPATSSEERTVEYNLGGKFRTLSGLAGLDDATPNSNATAYFRFLDDSGGVIAKADGSIARPAQLAIKVEGVVRLRIAYMVIDRRQNYYIEKLQVTLAGMELKSYLQGLWSRSTCGSCGLSLVAVTLSLDETMVR